MDTLEQLREARESAILKLEVKQLQAAASMPILEEWGDVVNTREYLTDDPSFGMQSLGYIYATNIDDRKDGAFRPVYETEADLARIRGQVRNLYAITAIPDGAKESLANYVLGTGFEFTADAVNEEDQLSLQLAAHCRGIIDRFCEETDFHGVIDREMHWRSREDGECFAQLVVTDGKVQVELLEADQIAEPQAARPLEDWLGVGSSCWKFGVHTPLGRTWLPLGYHVVRDGVGNDWEYVKADRMEHIKRNVTRNAKRGYSDFYGVIADLMHEAKLRRNMVQGAALQAAIAFIMQGAAGQTQAQLQATASADRVASYTRPAGSGGVSKVQNANHIPVGTILRAGYGQEYKAGPMGAERNAGFELVGQYVLRSIGVRWNMPEYLISGDASNANYSSTLVAQSPFVKARVADQQFYKRHFLSMLWKVLRIHFDSGRFSRFPGIDFDQLRLMVKLEATPPTVESRDPAQMASVHAAYLDKGLISKQTAREQAGLDHDQEEKRGAVEKPPEPKFMPPGFGGVQESWDASEHPRDSKGRFASTGSTSGDYGSAENSAVPHLTRMRRLRNAVGSVLEFMRKIPKFAAGGLERHEQVFADIDRWIGTAQRHLTTVHDVGGKALDRAETVKAEADKVRELVKRAKAVFESAGLPMVGERLTEDGRAGRDADGDGIYNESGKSKGRGAKEQSKRPRTKSEIAKASAYRVDAKIQRYAEEHNEPEFAKEIGGLSLRDNEPVDILILDKGQLKHGIELKTIVSNKAAKLTMKTSAMQAKAKWERKNKAKVHTVVLDDSEAFDHKGDEHDVSKRKIYYRRGYGSFRISSMHLVTGGMKELTALLDTPRNKLPEGAK